MFDTSSKLIPDNSNYLVETTFKKMLTPEKHPKQRPSAFKSLFLYNNRRRNRKQDARGPAGYFPPQISSKKTTGQQTCSLLTLFNIPIYEVCRKFDKNCIKTLKFGKFWVFCHFRFEFDIFFI